MSGGGAVQIYSNGLYVSRDLDFVSPAPAKEIARVVKALGFEPASGRHFVHPTCPFTLEFPPWPLAVGHALIHEWAGLSVAHGVIQMVTATQCVMDRLAAFYFWKDRQALDQAIAVARVHPIDLDAVRRWSKAEGQDVAFEEFARNCEQT